MRSAAGFALSTKIEAFILKANTLLLHWTFLNCIHSHFGFEIFKTCFSSSSGEEPSRITNHKLFQLHSRELIGPQDGNVTNTSNLKENDSS